MTRCALELAPDSAARVRAQNGWPETGAAISVPHRCLRFAGHPPFPGLRGAETVRSRRRRADSADPGAAARRPAPLLTAPLLTAPLDAAVHGRRAYAEDQPELGEAGLGEAGLGEAGLGEAGLADTTVAPQFGGPADP